MMLGEEGGSICDQPSYPTNQPIINQTRKDQKHTSHQSLLSGLELGDQS